MRRLIAWIGITAIGWATAAHAGSLEVAPTTIFLSDHSRAGVFYLTNHGTAPMVAQVEAYDWQQPDMDDHLISSNALIVSPPMAKLAPGQTQTIRLAVKSGKTGETLTQERAFRLMVSELPNPNPDSGSIQMLLQFSVPVFYGPHNAPAHIDWSTVHTDRGLLLAARNSGTRHLKISELSMVGEKGEKILIAPGSFSYILPGATHYWGINPWGASLSLTMHDEKDGTIEAYLPVSP